MVVTISGMDHREADELLNSDMINRNNVYHDEITVSLS